MSRLVVLVALACAVATDASCPLDFPFPSPAHSNIICYNTAAFASAGSGTCGSWCTQDVAIGGGCGSNAQRICAESAPVRAASIAPYAAFCPHGGITHHQFFFQMFGFGSGPLPADTSRSACEAYCNTEADCIGYFYSPVSNGQPQCIINWNSNANCNAKCANFPGIANAKSQHTNCATTCGGYGGKTFKCTENTFGPCSLASCQKTDDRHGAQSYAKPAATTTESAPARAAKIQVKDSHAWFKHNAENNAAWSECSTTFCKYDQGSACVDTCGPDGEQAHEKDCTAQYCIDRKERGWCDPVMRDRPLYAMRLCQKTCGICVDKKGETEVFSHSVSDTQYLRRSDGPIDRSIQSRNRAKLNDNRNFGDEHWHCEQDSSHADGCKCMCSDDNNCYSVKHSDRFVKKCDGEDVTVQYTASKNHKDVIAAIDATTIISSDVWELAINISPSDGHDMGFGSNYWFGQSALGAPSTSLLTDYISPDVFNKPSKFVAIVRHRIGSTECEAVKVFKWAETSKHFGYFFSSSYKKYGDDGPSATFVSESDLSNLKDITKDPIFGNTGDLQTNYWYSNNGVRVVMTNAYGYPTTANTDDIHGLGNEFGADTSSFAGSNDWKHDVGQRWNADCHGSSCPVMGTDHGSQWGSGAKSISYQYALFSSDSDEASPVFNCASTATPTAAPTDAPTTFPTAAPTDAPTDAPTAEPCENACSPGGSLSGHPLCNAQYCNQYLPGAIYRGRCAAGDPNHNYAVLECQKTCGIGSCPTLAPTDSPTPAPKQCKLANGCPLDKPFKYPGWTRCFATKWEAPRCDFGTSKDGAHPACTFPCASPTPAPNQCKLANGCPLNKPFKYPGWTRCFATKWEAPRCDFGTSKDGAHPACTFPCTP